MSIERLEWLVDRRVGIFREKVKLARELVEIGLIQPGDRLDLGELFQVIDVDLPSSELERWKLFSNELKRRMLAGVGEYLGVDITQLSGEKAIRIYVEEGVRGSPGEGGTDVMVFSTKFPELELHVMDCNSPKVGRRYDLVRAE